MLPSGVVLAALGDVLIVNIQTRVNTIAKWYGDHVQRII